MNRKSRAFSLIEVLVVVSTVSVVVAISLPALVTAKQRARSIVCRSNLRQLVLASTGYSNDNDGFCVPAAADYWNSLGTPWQAGLYRWHGKRKGPDNGLLYQRFPRGYSFKTWR